MGPDLSSTGKLIFAYASYTLVMLAYTAVNVPYSALLAVIHPKAEERTKATQYRFICASIGTILWGQRLSPWSTIWEAGTRCMDSARRCCSSRPSPLRCSGLPLPPRESAFSQSSRSPMSGRKLACFSRTSSWIALAVSGICVVVGLVARISSTAFYGKYYLRLGDESYLWWMDGTTLIITAGFLGQSFGALLTPTFTQVF